MVAIGLLVICLVFSSFSDTNALTRKEFRAQQMAVNSLEEFHKNFFSVVKDSSKNQIMSSFSLASVMGMLLNGAGGETRSQVRKSFGLVEDTTFKKSYKLVANQMAGGEDLHLNSANRVYYNEAFNDFITKDYLNDTKEHFLAEPFPLNFSNGNAGSEINQWVESQTNNKIKDVVSEDLDTNTALVLINAMYFKGQWETKFNDTFEGDFHTSKNEVVKAQMMKSHSESRYGYLYLEDLKAQAVEIPYKGGRISMIVILPDPESSLKDLENIFEVTQFNLLDFTEEDVDLTLPKFKIETTLNLNDPLKIMGMTDMFEPNLADFSGFGGTKSAIPGVSSKTASNEYEYRNGTGFEHISYIYVSDVLQKAFIEVNEEGTEAAAATVAQFVPLSASFPVPFVCDRPFLFLIRDNESSLTLFTGHVTDPTLSKV